MSRYECDVKHTSPRAQRNERLAAIEQELAGHPHRRVPRDLRRRHLLELATELFSERGFEAASMDELAQRAGVSKPVIYDQFGSKEGLVVAVVDAMGIELNEAIRPPSTAGPTPRICCAPAASRSSTSSASAARPSRWPSAPSGPSTPPASRWSRR